MSEYLSLYTDAELDELIALWKQALADVSLGQSYTIHNRSLTLANLGEIESTLSGLAREKARRQGAGTARVVTCRIERAIR